MKICVAQTRPIKGDISRNIDDHKRLIALATSHNTDIIVFPELSLTGYEPTLAQACAINQNDARFDTFQAISDDKQLTIGVGMPTKSNNGICISMLIFQPHKPRQIYSKRYLHADEEPFFVSGQNFPVLVVNQTNIALAICYELSVPAHAQMAFNHGAKIYIASVSKSADGVNNAAERLAKIARTYALPVLLSNNVGPADDFVGGGKTAVWNHKGNLLGQLDDTNAGILIYDTDTQEVIEKTQRFSL